MASLLPPGLIPATIPFVSSLPPDIIPATVSYIQSQPPLDISPTTIPSVSLPPPDIILGTVMSIPSLPTDILPTATSPVSALPTGTIPAPVPSVPPPFGLEPNFVNPVTLAAPIVTVSVILSILALVFLSMRLCTILRITRSVLCDDGVVVLAMAFSLAYVGLIISVRDYARHSWDEPSSSYTPSYIKITLAATIFEALAFLFSKLSVLLLLLRSFSPSRTFCYLVYIGIMWATITSIITLVSAGALCAPRHDDSIIRKSVIVRCTHEVIWTLVQGALNLPLNLYILLLPIPIIWKLKLEQQKKIGVTAIFATGFVACIVSTIGIVYRVKAAEGSDLPWNAGIVNILAIVEINLAIAIACMPTSASFCRYFFVEPVPPARPSPHGEIAW